MFPDRWSSGGRAAWWLALHLGVASAAQQPSTLIELSAAQQAAIGIETQVLAPGSLPGTGRLVFGGRIEFAELGPLPLLAPAAARVTAVYAHPGEAVKRGDAVLSLTGPDLLQAHAARQSAQAQADNALQKLKRDRALFEAGAISRSRLEASEAQERSARAALEASHAAMSGMSAAGAEGLRILAPADGIIMGRALAPGDAVAAGEVLAYVAHNPHVHAALAVPMSVARQLSLKDAALVRSASCESTGSVHAIGRDVEPESQSVAVHVTLDDEACFAPGETVSARLTPHAADPSRFGLPPTAFVVHGNRTLVFVTVAGGFEPVDVDPARARAGFASSPALKAGQRVVTRGSAALKAEWLKRQAP